MHRECSRRFKTPLRNFDFFWKTVQIGADWEGVETQIGADGGGSKSTNLRAASLKPKHRSQIQARALSRWWWWDLCVRAGDSYACGACFSIINVSAIARACWWCTMNKAWTAVCSEFQHVHIKSQCFSQILWTNLIKKTHLHTHTVCVCVPATSTQHV